MRSLVCLMLILSFTSCRTTKVSESMHSKIEFQADSLSEKASQEKEVSTTQSNTCLDLVTKVTEDEEVVIEIENYDEKGSVKSKAKISKKKKTQKTSEVRESSEEKDSLSTTRTDKEKIHANKSIDSKQETKVSKKKIPIRSVTTIVCAALLAVASVAFYFYRFRRRNKTNKSI